MTQGKGLGESTFTQAEKKHKGATSKKKSFDTMNVIRLIVMAQKSIYYDCPQWYRWKRITMAFGCCVRCCMQHQEQQPVIEKELKFINRRENKLV